MSENTAGNPANFANRPHEEVSEIGRKGGQSSHHGGFASMDPDKQVRCNMTQITAQTNPYLPIIARHRIQGRPRLEWLLRKGQRAREGGWAQGRNGLERIV